MLAVYLIAQGDAAEEAILRIREVEKVAVETPRQIQFLEQFAQRFRQPSVLSFGTNEARGRE
jgi:protein-tyrosine phosphatase